MSSDLKSAKKETLPKHGDKSVLAICGGGNVAHAVPVVASQNFDGDIVWSVAFLETLGLKDLTVEPLMNPILWGDGPQYPRYLVVGSRA